MTEAYVIEATLEWKTNVLEVLRQMARGFEEVNNLVVGLGDALKELTASNRGVSSLAKQLEKLRVAPGVMDDMRQLGRTTADLVAQQRELADSAKQSAAAWREMADASRRVRMPGPGGAGSRSRGGGHVAAMDAAMGAQMTGDFGMGLLERGFHEYADVQLQQVMAQSDKKVTDAVLARANALVQTLQKQYPGLTQSEGLTLFRNTMGIFGDPNESLDALPGAARLQQLYQLAPLGRGGTGGSEVRAAEKAGDALQAFINPQTGRLDKGLYEQWMNFQARSYQAGGGLVDAKGWLAFARTSRSAGIGLSPHALEEAQALLEMSPGRTGTALMSAFQVFGASTKHMTKSNRSAWHDMGLLTKSGDIIDRAGYQDDPFQWVWNDLLPHLAAKGVKTREQVLKWLTENGQRSTVSGILADIAIGRTPITNTAAKMDRQDSNLVDKLVNSDTGKLAALQAAETNFFVALGKFTQGPGLALINNLAQGMNNLADAMNAHPDAARRIIEIGGGLALLSKIAGDSAMAYLFVGGPLVGGLKSLSRVLMPFVPGGPASLGLAGLIASLGIVSLRAQEWSRSSQFDFSKRRGETDDQAAGDYITGQTGVVLSDRPRTHSEWGTVGDAIARWLHVTVDAPIILDGRVIGRALARGTSTGGSAGSPSSTTAFDNKRSLYPGAVPAGPGH